MNTSSQWLGLSFVVCSAACGSSFQANDSATGGSPSGGSPSGGNASGGNASGGSGSAAGSDNGGRGGKSGSGGSVSTGGNLGIAGDVSVVGGGMGVSGASGAGGVAGNAGSTSGGGPSGGSSSGGSSSGGAAGSATAGTGGGSGASCTQLWSSYQDFVAKTAVCDAGSTVECVANNAIVDQCNCAVPFNHNSASLSGAKKALQDWKDAGCVFKPCGCLTQGTPACLITSGTTAYTCQFGPAVIQM